MPKWPKVVLIVGGTLFVILVITGFIGVRALQRAYHEVERESELARIDGEVFGMTSTTEECVEETVNRSADCAGFNPTCVPPLGAFMWACVEGATYDPAFCAGIPPPTEEDAMMEWGRSACARYGQEGNDMCAITLASISGFCESKKMAY